jgi:ferredoxin-NADP reductase
LHLGKGLVRSYSLCNSSVDRQRYVVSVLNDRKSRGGSRFVHQTLRVGAELKISAPRNNFQLDETAPHTVLVAGGIGITPILSMLRRLIAQNKSVEVIYCARSRKEAAFIEVIETLTKERVPVHWHFDEERGTPPNLVELLDGKGADTHYYCCGPTPMLDAFERSCERLHYANVHIERFAAVHVEPTGKEGGFVVELRKAGKSVNVPAGKSILDSLIEAGANPEHSCKEGICGACETAVIEGDIDHRDGVLTKHERDSGKTMMICVSRCRGSRLVLDI